MLEYRFLRLMMFRLLIVVNKLESDLFWRLRTSLSGFYRHQLYNVHSETEDTASIHCTWLTSLDGINSLPSKSCVSCDVTKEIKGVTGLDGVSRFQNILTSLYIWPFKDVIRFAELHLTADRNQEDEDVVPSSRQEGERYTEPKVSSECESTLI